MKQAAGKVFIKSYRLTILLAVPSYLFVAYVLISGLEKSIYAAAAYALSSYALILSVTAAWRIGKTIKGIITNHRLWKRYRTDFVFRIKISLIPGIIINVIYVMLKLIMGYRLRSVWMTALGIYYICLLLLRVSLLRGIYRQTTVTAKRDEYRVTKLYGFYLLLLDTALCGIVLYSLYRGAEYSYPGYFIYAMAAYTFYAVITAAVGLYKNRRHESVVYTTLNILKLTTALVALFALETAMLSTFGEDSSRIFRQYMTAGTGFVIVAVILVMAFYLICRIRPVNTRTAKFKEK